MGETVTMWRVTKWSEGEIAPVQVVSHTAAFAVVRTTYLNGSTHECREKKERDDSIIFSTFEEAKEYLIERAKRRVLVAEAEWQRAKNHLNKSNDLKKPDAPQHASEGGGE